MRQKCHCSLKTSTTITKRLCVFLDYTRQYSILKIRAVCANSYGWGKQKFWKWNQKHMFPFISSVMRHPPWSSTASKHCETQASLYPFANQHVLPTQSNNRNSQGRINCFLYPKKSWRAQTALICVNKCKPLNSNQSILGSPFRAIVLLLLTICQWLLLHQPESGFP